MEEDSERKRKVVQEAADHVLMCCWTAQMAAGFVGEIDSSWSSPLVNMRRGLQAHSCCAIAYQDRWRGYSSANIGLAGDWDYAD